jgi:phosphatidylglycerol:prolipoprotein diacylglycerol transferase
MGKRALSLFCVIGIALLIFFLSRVFSGQLILPQYFSIGPLTVHYYGIVMALAVACAFFVAIKRAPQYGIDARRAEDLIFWLVIGGFVGARIYHVITHFLYYSSYPGEILKVWNGGLSIFGAILGGLLVLGFLSKTYNLKPTTSLDWLTPSLIVGQIIGRFGNLFNYEAFGYPTNLPWKMFVPPQFRPEQYQEVAFFHPFFLYEATGSAVMLLILLKIIKPKAPGQLFFSYLLLYNILRFAFEFIRLDSTFVYGLRLNAYVALLMFVCSATVLLWTKRYGKKT